MMLARAYRWLRAEWPFALVVATLLAAALYLYVYPDHWRRGTGLMGVALLGAGVLRLTLPAPRVGMLHVRSRWFDTTCYLALGVVILGVDIRLH